MNGPTTTKFVQFQSQVEGKKYQENRKLKPFPMADPNPDVQVTEVVGEAILDIRQSVKVFGQEVGTASIGISRARIDNSVNEILREVFWITLVIGVIGVVGALVLAYLLVIPVNLLVKGTMEIVKGRFAVRVPVKSHDELGDLTIAFNNMAEGLEQREK